ncbi:GTP-binding protein [Phytoactinopolyspora halotolerans]|uniref:ABC transporter n=1 Tax=Phytoactinopolyspora halotolerans TaxID=1981512 RepID=A0A6L9SC54_9ACTN|nr:GTP-binding protein [Phytoactinopolyspora halotolerans]NEE02667.1 ABC transporter [Phytoactinopolyspora halotolerans]
MTARTAALSRALDAGSGRFFDPSTAEARKVLERADARMDLSTEHTVVALAGSTGGGKSSLFNAISGLDIARVGVRRPTTSQPLACVWGAEGAQPLLDWLGIPALNRISRESELDPDAKDGLDGLILLDLPDHDSTEVQHRKTVDRMVEQVDLFVWVMDPQKYADATVHERYLQPLAEHSDVVVVALNQIDRLTKDDAEACVADLRRLLDDDGLGDAPIVPLSAATGEGLDALMDLLRRTAETRRASVQRVDADATRAAGRMIEAAGSAEPGAVTDDDRGRLVDAMAAAADVGSVAAQAGHAYLRPSKRVPQPQIHVHRERVESAVRDLGATAAGSLTRGWGGSIRSVADEAARKAPEELEAALGSIDLVGERRGVWWRLAGALEWLALLVGMVGGLWALTIQAEEQLDIGWLDRQDIPKPEIAGSSLPLALLLAGTAVGLIVAVARAASARRARQAWTADVHERLMAAVERTADDVIVTPLRVELERYDTFRTALREASS